MRRVALAALALTAALVAVPAAGAWTTLSGGVQNIVVPSMIVTQAGTELVSFESPNGDTISVARAGGSPKVVVANDPIAGRTQLVQQPSGAIQLYFPNAAGVGRMTSTDDGASWTGPIQTLSHTVGGVMGAAVMPDGTPLFSQDGTGFVNVFRGLNGETVKNVYPRCCGYAESLAVDSTGLVQAAFYSNADADGAFVYEPLGGDLTPGAATVLKPTAPHDDRVALVSDKAGNTFMAWPPGYPTATAFTVVPFRGGQPAGDGVSFRASFGGGDPHMALSVDAQDRLWAAWTGQGAVHVARSRTHGMDFGATVSLAVPGTAYQISAVGIPGDHGEDRRDRQHRLVADRAAAPPGALGSRLQDDEEGRQEEDRQLVRAGARRRLRRDHGDRLRRRPHGPRERVRRGRAQGAAVRLSEGCSAGLHRRLFQESRSWLR